MFTLFDRDDTGTLNGFPNIVKLGGEGDDRRTIMHQF